MQQPLSFRNFQSRNSVTNELVAEFPFLSNDEVTKKIERSWQAFQTYSEKDLNSRAQILRKLASLIQENVDKYAKIMTQEMGKPINESKHEVQFGAKVAQDYADKAEKLLAPTVITTENKKSLVEYFPTGPIYIMVPFNVPFILAFVNTIPTLLLGNTVLYRPADSTPLLGKAIEELFIQAGFNNGEFQLFLTSPDQTELIISNKQVRGISFTGSTRAGANIASIAGKYTKKAVMELGGSDPFLVLDDADVEKAAQVATQSRLNNCGQICCAAKRFLIDDRIFDRFKEKLIENVSKVKPGDPTKSDTQLGPLARSDLRANIERQVKEGAKEGAKLLYGGKRPEDPELQRGNFYMPTIFEVERKDNVLFREETFGPVFALMKVKGEDEMVKLANDTDYGLGGTVMSENLERAQKIAKQIDTGSITINGPLMPDLETPFGGVKGSGFGRTLGEWGLHEFANIKTTMINQE
jgi:succinate-semialdehyde dehydrogenase/glutarate-semialdehyde dehydrogenase